MAKQATITEIAKRAGVSIGTVDRVLHNRAGVSEKSRAKIQAILDEVGYRINLHTSAVALKKEYHIVITVPQAQEGEYWDTLLSGTRQAMDEYSDIHTVCDVLPYDQFDPASCRKAYEGIPDMCPDAVIIGPTFDAETQTLCSKLEKGRIPYVFVDTTISDTHPLAAYTADQPAGGSLVGKLLDSIIPAGKDIALILSRFGSNGKAQNMEQRRIGLHNYIEENGNSRRLLECEGQEREDLTKFFSANPDIGGVCVLNSRGYVVADFLNEFGYKDVKVVAFDLTEKNVRSLREGSIFALVCQRPERQGFLAVTTLLEYLLYRSSKESGHYLMPLDVVLRENLPFYLGETLR